MIIFPYSTALTLARPPIVTYAVTLICVMVFFIQIIFPVTEGLMYYPDSWNPLKMIVSSLAHTNWIHLMGNIIFFLAFAPALEILLANKIRYLWIMLFISIFVNVCYSVSIQMGSSEPLPSLGFSGVVMGMIGLSAYLMPLARIRVFWWYIVFWKTFYVPAWIFAVAYLGLETWKMFTFNEYAGINVVAHVAGGFAGYLYGFFWLKDRKEETREELADEIEEMKLEQRFGTSHTMSFRGRKDLLQQQEAKIYTREHDKIMRQVYKMVTVHRDSDAIYLLMEKYDALQTQTPEFEALFDHIEKWGPSRTLLCIGRLIIYRLDKENRHGRAIFYIEKCQKISPQFILADLSRTIYFAQTAMEMEKPEVAKNLVTDSSKRYGNMLDNELCHRISQNAVG